MTTLISTDHKRGMELETPLPETDHIDRFTELFPATKSIPLWDVFDQINQVTKFTEAFEPFDSRRNIKRPDAICIYAALIQRTTRKGFDKIARQVGDIDKDRLEDTARIFLTPDNVAGTPGSARSLPHTRPGRRRFVRTLRCTSRKTNCEPPDTR
jgi:hypothetical protein